MKKRKDASDVCDMFVCDALVLSGICVRTCVCVFNSYLPTIDRSGRWATH